MKGAEILTSAPLLPRYGQEPAPGSLEAFALEIGALLEGRLSPVTADIGFDEGGLPRLFDLGAVSTTAFLEGMDIPRLGDELGALV